MRALIALLLFSYPHDFRTHYRAQIMHELDEMPGSAYAMRIAVDIVFAGLSMRAESLWRDLRFATRVLLKAPLFTIIVISTLALAIAGNAVIFSMLDAVLLKPLPYANAERIGLIDQIPPPGAPQRFVFVPLAPERERIAREAAAFSETASIATGVDSDIRVHGTMRSVERAIVTPGYFHLIGAHAEIGRLFTQSDSASDRTAVISDAVWRRDFGADPAAVGSTITIINSNGRPDGAAYTIRGVLPATTLDVGFRALDRDDVWTIAPHYGRRDAQPLAAILARLKDGATWASARADLTRITPKVGASAARTGLINRITPLTDSIFGGAQEFLWIVFGGVSAVLLIACANIASLLLARGAARSAEFAVRTTLGASARRIGAQLLTEMTVLFAAGAAGGLALATFALPAVVALMPEPYPRLDEARIDGNVVLYVCALTCIVTLVAGIIPTLWRLRSRPNDTLKAAGRNATDYGARARFVLVAVEVAVAFALTVCSGLMLRSYVSLTHVDVGFEPRGVYNAVFDLKNSADPSPARRIAERIMHLAGVTDVAIATSVPFSRVSMNAATVHIAGGPVPAPNVFDTRFSTAIADVSADFVSLMRIPVLAGRAFIDADRAAPVAIVNAAFVKRFVPHGDPIGKHVLFGQPAPRSWRIIGVVGNARDSLTAAPDHCSMRRSVVSASISPFKMLLPRNDRSKSSYAPPVHARTSQPTSRQSSHKFHHSTRHRTCGRYAP
jgi:predicted permease